MAFPNGFVMRNYLVVPYRIVYSWCREARRDVSWWPRQEVASLYCLLVLDFSPLVSSPSNETEHGFVAGRHLELWKNDQWEFLPGHCILYSLMRDVLDDALQVEIQYAMKR